MSSIEKTCLASSDIKRKTGLIRVGRLQKVGEGVAVCCVRDQCGSVEREMTGVLVKEWREKRLRKRREEDEKSAMKGDG